MSYIKIQPPGVMPIKNEDRKAILPVTGGDSWTLEVNLYNPECPSEPATPDNSIVEISLSETQFEDPLWQGGWYTGVFPDRTRPDLCHVVIPRYLTKLLRRGSYLFSIRVSDVLQSVYTTECQGSFLVEYTPTSDQHSIPYKDAMGQTASGDMTDASFAKEFERFKDKFDFSSINPVLKSDSLSKLKTAFNAALEKLNGIRS